MSGEVVCAAFNEVITVSYPGDSDWANQAVYSVHTSFFRKNKKNTIILIFSLKQDEHLHLFEECPFLSIVYKSKKAVNKVPEHGTKPRNTVVVIDIIEEKLPLTKKQKDEQSSKNLTMPTL
jgi:hypothetical protein